MKILKKMYYSLRELLNTIYLMFNSFTVIFTRWKTGGTLVLENTVKQVLFTGIGGLQVVGLAGFGFGLVLSIIFFSFGFPNDILTNLHGQVLTIVIVRELGPLLTALILISRSGTAMATEIGNMNANREFDALTSMGIDVVHYVITPRILGMVLAIICLNVYFSFISVIISAVVFNINNISYNVFFNTFFDSLEFNNIFLSFLKTIGSGIIISTISCYEGYRKKITFNDVPKILTRATGKCVVWCFLYYGFITILSYI